MSVRKGRLWWVSLLFIMPMPGADAGTGDSGCPATWHTMSDAQYGILDPGETRFYRESTSGWTSYSLRTLAGDVDLWILHDGYTTGGACTVACASSQPLLVIEKCSVPAGDYFVAVHNAMPAEVNSAFVLTSG